MKPAAWIIIGLATLVAIVLFFGFSTGMGFIEGKNARYLGDNGTYLMYWMLGVVYFLWGGTVAACILLGSK